MTTVFTGSRGAVMTTRTAAGDQTMIEAHCIPGVGRYMAAIALASG